MTDRKRTHGPGCCGCGPGHYDCAVAEIGRLRSIIIDLKDWDCDVSGGLLSIPLDLRRRMQDALAAHPQPASDVARLVEALEEIRSRSSIDLAMRSDQFELTALLGDIHQIAGAALAQEEGE